MPPDVKALLQRHETLKRKKQFWFPLYQAISQYVMLRKQYFTTEQTDGPFVLNKVFDATALHAVHRMAGSILGQIWPNPFESFEFVPQVAQDEAVFSDSWDMMLTVNEILPVNLAATEAGVMTSFHEAISDAAAFGTGAVAVIETDSFRTPVRTKSMDAKTMTIDENESGQVDTVYMEKALTVANLVQRYGYDNVSERTQQLYRSKKLDQTVKILHAIEPRRELNPLKLGSGDMPFASIHIEIDQQHLLEEGGFNEMPIIVFRFWTNVGEVYGRSPAMDALPDIRAVNKLVETFELAGEMGLNPPRMVSHESIMGAGKKAWGPGQEYAIHESGRLQNGRPPIEPIFTVQNPGWAVQRIQDLRDTIKQYFMLEQLSDLSNTSRQTLGEATIRNELRMFETGPMLIRILLELVSPFLDRTFNILLQKGYFGVVRGSAQDLRMQAAGIQPKYISADFIDSRMSGLKGYRINFISPAARLMKLEEAQGTRTLTEYVMATAQVKPEVTDNFNFDEGVRAMQRLGGASQKLLYSPEEVERQRKARAQADMQVQQLQEAQAAAMTFKDAAKGVKDVTGSQQPR